MTILAVVFAVGAALLHVYIWVLEAFRWNEPATRKTFGVSEADAPVLAPMAYNQGFYNLFLAITTIVGVALLGEQGDAGRALALAGTGSIGSRRGPGAGDPRPVDGARRDHPGHPAGAGRALPAAVDVRPSRVSARRTLTGRARRAPRGTTDAPSPLAAATRFIEPGADVAGGEDAGHRGREVLRRQPVGPARPSARRAR